MSRGVAVGKAYRGTEADFKLAGISVDTFDGFDLNLRRRFRFAWLIQKRSKSGIQGNKSSKNNRNHKNKHKSNLKNNLLPDPCCG